MVVLYIEPGGGARDEGIGPQPHRRGSAKRRKIGPKSAAQARQTTRAMHQRIPCRDKCRRGSKRYLHELTELTYQGHTSAMWRWLD